MFINRIKILPVILWCFYTSLSFSQSFDLKTQLFNEDNGLSRYANYIHKDSRGIIWVGTQFGLYRFDGQGFTHFDGNVGLPFRQIMEIYEDSEGWFWLYKSCNSKPNCEKNLAFFHPITRQVLTFEERFGSKVESKAEEIQHIVRDSFQFYLSTNDKLLIWSSEKGIREKTISGFEHAPRIIVKISEHLFGGLYTLPSKNEILYMTVDTSGYINTFSKSSIFNRKDCLGLIKLSRYKLEYDKVRIQDFEFSFDSDGRMVKNTLSFKLPLIAKDKIYFDLNEPIYANQSGDFFHPNYGNMTSVDEFKSPPLHGYNNPNRPNMNFWVKGKILKYPSYPFRNYNLSYRGYLFDEDAQLSWIASRPGVQTLQYVSNYFKHFSNPIEDLQLASGAFISKGGKVYLGIHRSIFEYNKNKGDTPIFTPIDFGIFSKRQTFISDNETNDLWIINTNKIIRLNENRHIISEYDYKEVDELGNAIWFDNQIWIVANNDILILNPQRNQISTFTHFNGFEKAKKEGFQFVLKIDNNHLWILTNKSLYLCSKKEGIIDEYKESELGTVSQLNQISNAKDGGFWVSSLNGAIYVPKPGIPEGQLSDVQANEGTKSEKRGIIKYSSSSTGLPNNEILAAFEDDYGFVWMPTPHGLIQMQIETGLSKLYTKADGLSNSGFQDNSFAEGLDGTFYFGGYEGFNIFHPKDFKDAEFAPKKPLVILDYEQHSNKSGKIEYRLEEILNTGKIILNPGDKLFNIRVALEDYSNVDGHRFAYKIEGFQEEWLEDGSNLIRISGLPYGEFMLNIKGRLHNGLYSQSELHIPIIVLRPFYLTTWFLVTIGLSGVFGIYFFNFWRTKQLKRRQKLLEQAISNATETIRQDKELIESQATDLRELDKLKSQFFANVSHELRTPLTLILGPIESIFKRNKIDDEDMKSLKMVKKNGQQLGILINEILDLTKLEAGKMELENTTVLWHQFLRSIIANFEPLAHQNQIDFQFIYEGNELLQVKIDKKKVRTILTNFLSNAFKFTDSEGSIIVKAKNTAQSLNLEVRDTGRGIPQHDLPYIFDRFFQAKNQNRKPEGGTGIGMALSKEYIQLMNGNIEVKSETGKGTTFTIQLPRVEVLWKSFESEVEEFQETNNESKAIENINSATNEYSERKPLVLIVEDNVDMQNYIQSLLKADYQICLANNGMIALEKMGFQFNGKQTQSDRQNNFLNPDLIISDIMMPVMDGYDLLRTLKSESRYQSVPVIMLSAHAGMEDKLMALRIGVDDYVTKPFVAEELLARVKNLLENARNRQFANQNKNIEMIVESIPERPQMILNEEAQAWLDNIEEIIKRNVGEVNYTVDSLVMEIDMSKRQFYRELSSLIGQTPNQYIKTIRLNIAREWLQTGKYDSIKAVALSVGFKDVVYFSRQFKKEFGKLPSEYELDA